MKAPNKIYVHVRTEPRPSITFSEAVEKNSTNEEYIRKDALLDYFHQRIEELNSPLNGVFGSTERDNCNERISELLLLIDKLNEM